MAYYETILFDFLTDFGILEKFNRTLSALGEDPHWYLEQMGDEPMAITLAFGGYLRDTELLDWEIIQQQFYYYCEQKGYFVAPLWDIPLEGRRETDLIGDAIVGGTVSEGM